MGTYLMKARIGLAATVVTAGLGAHQSLAQQLPAGHAETVLSLPAGNQPEGIAFDADGTMYVGNRYINGAGLKAAEILRVDSDGTVALFAELLPAPAAASGLLGLAVDEGGDVFAANVTFNPASHGVYRISEGGGQIERLAGSEGMIFPNAIAFDDDGLMYVTDSIAGAIWRFDIDSGAPGAPWAQHELLLPLAADPFGFPLPGANGIAYDRPGSLYVANTEKGLVARVSINKNGSAGAVELVAASLLLATVDGIAMDARGDVYGVIPGFSVIGTFPLVRVDASAGIVAPVVTDPAEASKFDVPLSVTFGPAAADHKTAYVTNGDLPVAPGGPGPSVLRVGIRN